MPQSITKIHTNTCNSVLYCADWSVPNPFSPKSSCCKELMSQEGESGKDELEPLKVVCKAVPCGVLQIFLLQQVALYWLDLALVSQSFPELLSQDHCAIYNMTWSESPMLGPSGTNPRTKVDYPCNKFNNLSPRIIKLVVNLITFHLIVIAVIFSHKDLLSETTVVP